MKSIEVYNLPQDIAPEKLAGATAIPVDILRACTTIVYALAAGASHIIPCLEIHEARRIAASMPESLLGGERAGVKIEGFDFGNSPQDYVAGKVAGKPIIFTTTNGTRAMQTCRQAQRVLIACFANHQSVCQAASDCRRIALVCAGTDGQPTLEDILFCGSICENLTQREDCVLNTAAQAARQAWRQALLQMKSGAALSSLLSLAKGGQNLIGLGFQRDIEIASRLDCHKIVPELDTQRWKIHLR